MDLCDDVLTIIFSFLDGDDVYKIGWVCRNYRNISRQETVWETIFSTHIPQSFHDKFDTNVLMKWTIESNKCTYICTKKNDIMQKFYHCITCEQEQGLKSIGICQVCMKECHQGHNIINFNDNKIQHSNSCKCFYAKHNGKNICKLRDNPLDMTKKKDPKNKINHKKEQLKKTE